MWGGGRGRGLGGVDEAEVGGCGLWFGWVKGV